MIFIAVDSILVRILYAVLYHSTVGKKDLVSELSHE